MLKNFILKRKAKRLLLEQIIKRLEYDGLYLKDLEVLVEVYKKTSY